MVGIEYHQLISDHLKEDCNNSTDSVEPKLGNTKQPLYDGIWLDNIYYLAFDDDPDFDDMVLPYVQEIKDKNIEEVDESYMEYLEKYIGTHVVVPG